MTVVDTYTIEIIWDGGDQILERPRVIREMMAEAEENLTDLLPAGYRARIRQWDDNSDEPTQEEDDA